MSQSEVSEHLSEPEADVSRARHHQTPALLGCPYCGQLVDQSLNVLQENDGVPIDTLPLVREVGYRARAAMKQRPPDHPFHCPDMAGNRNLPDRVQVMLR